MDMKGITGNTSNLHLMVVTLSYFDPNTKKVCLFSDTQQDQLLHRESVIET
jgi:hypothetical protein